MKLSSGGAVTGTVRGRGRVLFRLDVAASRFVGVLLLLGVLGCSAVLIVREHLGYDRSAPGLFGWSLAVLAAAALIARGVFLGRPVTIGHAVAAAATVFAGLGAHFMSFGFLGNVLIGAGGLVLMAPTRARPQPELLNHVWRLVDATRGDPLAPFAMHSVKSYHFNSDGSAAIAYSTRIGFAVVSGDPIGDPTQFDQLVSDFASMCRTRGWRIIVLAAGERYLGLWRAAVGVRTLLAVPFGCDVVVDVGRFAPRGRRFRNLRQAVQRTHNCGVTTEFVDEQDLDESHTAELTEVLFAARRAVHTERGFCMILDGALEGRYPGVKLAIARDESGRAVAFHRYATAGKGSEVSLDVPFRRPDAPNGIDERLSVDMIAESKRCGGERLSLAFAAFPEIFDETSRGPLLRIAYRLTHLLDPLIRLESLYHYLSKFHALADRRYVVLHPPDIIAALVVLLWLEFVPRRRHRSRPGRRTK